MPRSVSRRAVLAGSPDDLENAFYEALQAGDLERLMACWSDDDEIVCVHPAGGRLIGHGAIRAAYAELLSPAGLAVWPGDVVRVQTLASAVHSVFERVRVSHEGAVREAVVLATNVYHRGAQGWRMVAHHASAMPLRAAPEPAPPSGKTLH